MESNQKLSIRDWRYIKIMNNLSQPTIYQCRSLLRWMMRLWLDLPSGVRNTKGTEILQDLVAVTLQINSVIHPLMYPLYASISFRNKYVTQVSVLTCMKQSNQLAQAMFRRKAVQASPNLLRVQVVTDSPTSKHFYFRIEHRPLYGTHQARLSQSYEKTLPVTKLDKPTMSTTSSDQSRPFSLQSGSLDSDLCCLTQGLEVWDVDGLHDASSWRIEVAD